jgi:hypothetical protein
LRVGRGLLLLLQCGRLCLNAGHALRLPGLLLGLARRDGLGLPILLGLNERGMIRRGRRRRGLPSRFGVGLPLLGRGHSRGMRGLLLLLPSEPGVMG